MIGTYFLVRIIKLSEVKARGIISAMLEDRLHWLLFKFILCIIIGFISNGIFTCLLLSLKLWVFNELTYFISFIADSLLLVDIIVWCTPLALSDVLFFTLSEVVSFKMNLYFELMQWVPYFKA